MKNNKFFSNLGLKLLALLIAFVVWFAVMNVEDSVISKTISDIPVEMLNGDVILENGNLYNITDGETVEIIVRGPRSIVDGLEADDFEATADLAVLSVTNSTIISVSANSNVSAVDAKKITVTPVNQYVTLSIEEEAEKSIPVRVITTGNVADGYAVGSPVPTPNMITVSGPESVLTNIVEARAVVDVSNASADVVSVANIGCIDGYGTAVEKDNITLSVSTVSVSIPVYSTKTIKINVETAGTVQDGYAVRSINYEPTSVVVAGSKEDLDKLSAIDISDIVVTDASENIEKNIDILNYLPSGIFLADDSTNDLAVNVVIEEMSESEITVSKSSVRIIGKNADYTYDILSPDSFKVRLSGFAEDLDGLTADDINPRINVKGLTIGEQNVEVEFDDPDKYDIKDRYDVKIEVSGTE